MRKTWILVADAHRARFFEGNASNPLLGELANFVYPHTTMGGEPGVGDISGDAGKGHGRTGHAGTQFEPKTSDGAKERHSFAKQLADFLNKGVADQHCDRIELIAPSPMLGELKPLLSQASQKVLHRSLAADLTHCQGEDLKARVKEALSLPA
jgi:protein required for attachment to host cells